MATPTKTPISELPTRTWHVLRADGKTVSVEGKRAVIAQTGALIIMAGSAEAVRIFNRDVWLECEPTSGRTRR
jgi:hypothetical protein